MFTVGKTEQKNQPTILVNYIYNPIMDGCVEVSTETSPPPGYDLVTLDQLTKISGFPSDL